ncbi:MAG: SDR family NAD(P)-dependent oxidoreductase [Myxococcota bacterium]
MFDLKDRVALVTGAGKGIGAEIARTFARQGAKVLIADIDASNANEVAKEIGSADGIAQACPFDVTDYAAAEEAIHDGESRLGAVDILVNNAGGVPNQMFPTPFLKTPREVWDPIVDMNLKGTFNCTHLVTQSMSERGYGRIISVSSDAGRVGNFGSSIYGASKAGIEGFMRTIARELGSKGVTANSVVLGLIDTVPAEFLEGRNAGAAYWANRIGTAKDVAAGVLYLASEEAGWVTGHSLVINGGGTTP